MSIIKQSTAYKRMVFLGSTGLTPSWQLSKNGSAFAAMDGTVTEISAGWYCVNLAASDTNTLGDLVHFYTAPDSYTPFLHDQVIASDFADIAAIKAKTDRLPSVDAGAINGLHILGTNVGTPNYTAGFNFGAMAGSIAATTGWPAHFFDLVINPTGTVTLTNSLKRGIETYMYFSMRSKATGGNASGLTVKAKISQNGSGFQPVATPISEAGEGYYILTLTLAEMDCTTFAIVASAPGCYDSDFCYFTTP